MNIYIGQEVIYNISNYDAPEWTGQALKLNAIVLTALGNSATLAVRGMNNIEPYQIRYSVVHSSVDATDGIGSFDFKN